MYTLVIISFLATIGYGWLNFTYTAPAALTYGSSEVYEGATFSYTICIGNTESYIHFDYQGPVRALLSVALGSTKPHIGGTTSKNNPRRYGNDPVKGKGAYAIVWGNENDMRNTGPTEWDTYVFEYELNDLEATGWWGTKLTECSGQTCAQLDDAEYDATSAFITISRNNIEGDPLHTYQFDPSNSYVLAQWAYAPYDFYWYMWEHTHNTRGSFAHHFPTQTVADKKTLTKTLLVDVESGESSGISLALEMDATTGKITIELWGPSDRWWGINWGGHSEGDALIYTTGEGSHTKTLGLWDYAVYGFEIGNLGSTKKEGIYPDEAYTGSQDWGDGQYLELVDTNGEVYVKVERLLISTDYTDKTSTSILPTDVDFNINDDSLLIFVAKGNSTGYTLEYHDDNYWISEVQLTASGNKGTTQTWMDVQTEWVNCDGLTSDPTTSPTTAVPTTANPTGVTKTPTTAVPTTGEPTRSLAPTRTPTSITTPPTTSSPTTASPTTAAPSTASPTTVSPTTASPITSEETTEATVRGLSGANTWNVMGLGINVLISFCVYIMV